MLFSPWSNEKADAARKAKEILDTISLVGTAATALRRLQDKFSAGNPLSFHDLSDFGIIISSLEYITKDGREHTVRASPVSHLLLAYNMRSSINHSKFMLENPCPKNKSISMWKLMCYLKGCMKSRSKKPQQPLPKYPSKSSSKIPMKRESPRCTKFIERLGFLNPEKQMSWKCCWRVDLHIRAKHGQRKIPPKLFPR